MMEEQNPWTVLAAQPIYDNNWISVTEFKVKNPNGGNGIYGKVHFKNHAIGIVAIDDEMNTYLVGQYRFPIDKYSWEIPEGGCPEGENLLHAAQRELLEETGLKAMHWQHIASMHLSNSVCDEAASIYVATGLQQFEAMPEETEQLVVKKLPFDEVYKMVMQGIITDSVTVSAILKAKLLLLNGSLQIPYRSVE